MMPGFLRVWYRHLLVYKRRWFISCVAPVSEPIVYLLAFGYGLSPLIGEISYNGVSVSYLEFMAPGMIGVGVLFQAFFEGAYGSFVRMKFQRTWTVQMTAPLSLRDVFLGDLLWAATKGSIAGLATALVAVLWGAIPILHTLQILPLIFLGSLVFAALGLLMTAIIKSIDQLNLPIFLFVVPMFALGGTYFPLQGLPYWLESLSSVLPLTLLCRAMRFHLEPGTPVLLNSLLLTLLLFCVSLVTYRAMHKRFYPS